MLSEDQKGFNLGIVSNLRLGKYTDLRFIPTLVFGERILNYHIDREEKRTMFLGITTKEACTLKYGQSILEPVYGGEEYDCSFSETEMNCKKR